MAVSIRELPPQRLHHLIQTPSGKSYRWSADEPKPQNVPSGLQFSSVVPGGFENAECTLPRKAHINYGDLERLSTWTVRGASGEIVWQGRLERAPRVSGNEVAVTPQAVGWQAALDDDQTAHEVYVDRDLSNWQGMSAQRKLNLYAAGFDTLNEGVVEPDSTTGTPSLACHINGGVVDPTTEFWYDAGPGLKVGRLLASWSYAVLTSGYTGDVFVADDDVATNAVIDTDRVTSTSGSGTLDFTPSTARRWAGAQVYATGTDGTDVDRYFRLTNLRVVGNHGLTLQGTAPSEGFNASDIIANAVSRWAPALSYTTGADGTIKPTSFVIPQATYREPTTAAEIVKDVNRFHIRDWAVWEGPTFYYRDRGDGARRWRARVRPAQLEETGPAVDRLWNGVLVRYQDVDGTQKTVGPTGSAADATSTDLIDTDPLNPANQRGIRRWDLLDMQKVSTLAGATEVGRRFLVETKNLDRSGKATLVGVVEDDRGIIRPASHVRAGDEISFVDASDTSYRRIVRAEYSHDSRSCAVDLDAPPDAMASLLERLGVVLVSLGL